MDGVTKVDRSGLLPVCLTQMDWAFVHQMFPYWNNDFMSAYDIKGPLRADYFKQSIDFLVNRNEVLRIQLVYKDNQIYQELLPSITTPFDFLDISDRSTEQKEKYIDDLIAAESKREIDLTRAPLWHLTLIKTGAQDHLFLMNIHHCIFDFWSKGLFAQELMKCYAAISNGITPTLPPIELGYLDFAVHQSSVQSNLPENKLKYWRELLSGKPTENFRFPSPHDFENGAGGDLTYFDIPGEDCARLKAFCLKEQITMNFLMQAVMCVTWYKNMRGRASDLLFCNVASKLRADPDFNNVMGAIANDWVPIRVDLGKTKTARDLTQLLRSTNIMAMKNNLPTAEILSRFNQGATGVYFNYLKLPFGDNSRAGELTMELRFLFAVKSFFKFPSEILFIFFESDDGRLRGCIESNQKAFPQRGEVIAIGENIKNLCSAIAANPEKLFETDLMSLVEMQF